MSQQTHGSAPSPAQYAEFSGVVQSRLWPALKDRISGEEMQSYISNPEGTMLRLRDSFTARRESGLVVPTSPFFANEKVKSDSGRLISIFEERLNGRSRSVHGFSESAELRGLLLASA